MKKILSLLLLTMLCAPAVIGKNIQRFTVYPSEISKGFNPSYLEIDSVIISGRINDDDFSVLNYMTVFGRLSGIDLSDVNLLTSFTCFIKIPDMAFYGYGPLVNASNSDNDSSNHEDVRSKLEYITLPSYVDEIGSKAFSVSNLKSITIPRGIKYIAPDAFEFCDSLRTIRIKEPFPPKIDSCNALFSSMNAVKILVPVGSKQYYADAEGWSLLSPDRILEEDSLFVIKTIDLNEEDLSSALSSSDHVDSLVISGEMTSSNCDILHAIYRDNKITGIDFSGCRFESDTIPAWFLSLRFSEINTQVVNSSLMYVTLPENIKCIGKNAFFRTHLQSIVLPDSLRILSDAAFRNNYFLHSSVVIPDGVTKIGEAAFSGCDLIQEIRIPSSVETMGLQSLDVSRTYIGKFKHDFYVDRLTPPTCIGDPFDQHSCNDLMTLYVPVGAKQNYLDAPYFKDFWRIIETPELTGGATAIDGVESGVTELGNGYADGVYTLDGKRIADTMTDGMAKGLYVVKRGAVISKVAVR